MWVLAFRKRLLINIYERRLKKFCVCQTELTKYKKSTQSLSMLNKLEMILSQLTEDEYPAFLKALG